MHNTLMSYFPAIIQGNNNSTAISLFMLLIVLHGSRMKGETVLKYQ